MMVAMSYGPVRASLSTPSRGAASLVVVMILFFIITLVAAYTSRNLLFEQRTSANQYRATLAFETAEAGLEWAIARLNEGRMNDDCTEIGLATAVTTPPQPSFRERYLSIDPTTGVITAPDKLAGCAFNGTGWVCDCPETGNPAPAGATPGNPTFWVKFRHNQVGGRPGVVRIQVNACTRNDEACLNFARQAQSGDGLATVWTMVALRRSLALVPAAALTVRDTVSYGGGSPRIENQDDNSGGITIHAGRALTSDPNITLVTIPGTPPDRSRLPPDPALLMESPTLLPPNDPASRMFISFFGTRPSTFLGSPGVAFVDCTGGCDSGDVNAVARRQPGRAIHIRGGGRLDIDAAIPENLADPPVLLIADGDVRFAGPHEVRGLVYSRAANWNLRGGNGTFRGAVIAEQSFQFDNDNPAIIFDRNVLLGLQQFPIGDFARVPGSWRDFQPGANP